MVHRRPGAVGQPLHDAPARSVRPELAAHPAPYADQGRNAPRRVTAPPGRPLGGPPNKEDRPQSRVPSKLPGRPMTLGKLGAPRVVLALLCGMYLILFVDRVSMSTAAPLMKGDLHLSNTQLGLAFSAFAIPYALFQLIGGWIGDKFGPRLTLSVGCAIVGLSTILTGAVGGFASLFAMRLALGFGEGAALPTATRAMASWTPVESWGFAQGITHSFARIGNALTPPLIAALLVVVSWRASFVVLGVASLAWLLVWAWYYRNDPRDHPSITQADLAALPAPV